MWEQVSKNFYLAFQRMKLPAILFLLLLISGVVLQSLLISEKYNFITKINNFLIILVATYLLIKGVHFGREKFEEYFNFKIKQDNFRERKIFTQILYIEKIINIFIVLLAIFCILINFNSLKNLGIGLLTSAGAASIIVGIAAQKTLSNIVAGFQIAFTQPMRIDDSVLVENEWGRIEEITLTYVTINLWDRRRLIVPITYFLEKPFQNWTKHSASIIGTVFLYADYSINIEALRQELDKILDQTDLWDRDVKVAQVTHASEEGIEIRILVSARNAPDVWNLRCYVREKLVAYITKEQTTHLPQKRIEVTVH